MDKKLTWVEVAMLLLGFAAATYVIAAAFFLLTANMGARIGDLATWFGAFGTMAAVGAAYLVGERQAASARRQAEEQNIKKQREHVDSLLAVLEACEEVVQSFWDEYKLEAGKKLAVALTYDRNIFDSLIFTLATFNLASLGSANAIRKMVQAQYAFSNMQKSINTYLNTKIPDGNQVYGGEAPAELSLRVGNLKNAFVSAHAALRKELG